MASPKGSACNDEEKMEVSGPSTSKRTGPPNLEDEIMDMLEESTCSSQSLRVAAKVFSIPHLRRCWGRKDVDVGETLVSVRANARWLS